MHKQKEILSHTGLIYSEQSSSLELFCKPKIMPIQSKSLQRVLKVQKEVELQNQLELSNEMSSVKNTGY